jgi:hypothetical protein
MAAVLSVNGAGFDDLETESDRKDTTNHPNTWAVINIDLRGPQHVFLSMIVMMRACGYVQQLKPEQGYESRKRTESEQLGDPA